MVVVKLKLESLQKTGSFKLRGALNKLLSLSDEQKNKVIENIPLKRMGSEKDIAETVKFLAHSEYITGQIIRVDGGRSL